MRIGVQLSEQNNWAFLSQAQLSPATPQMQAHSKTD